MNLNMPWYELIKLTPVQLEHWKDQVDAAHVRRISDLDLEEAAFLQKHGFTPEPRDNTLAMFQWYWRAPAKPGRPKGRLFLSPTRAVNFVKRAQTPPSLSCRNPDPSASSDSRSGKGK